MTPPQPSPNSGREFNLIPRPLLHERRGASQAKKRFWKSPLQRSDMERGFRGEVSLIDAYNYRTSLKALWLQKNDKHPEGRSFRALQRPYRLFVALSFMAGRGQRLSFKRNIISKYPPKLYNSPLG